MPIKECVCNHKFQDEKYGRYKRVANVTDSVHGHGYRCTVCGKDIAQAATKKVVKKAEPAKGKKGR
jgi:hypothetical protein